MGVIYETSGKAREYCELAVNLYQGCSHACTYCWAPLITRESREQASKPRPRKDILERLGKEVSSADKTRPVLLSFLSDPYQEIEGKLQLTRQALTMLKSHGVKVMILTKGGMLAARDFGLLTSADSVGATLTFLSDKDSLLWEPGAALPQERIEMLKQAKAKGIGTWVSLEPVIDTKQTLDIIRQTHRYVDEYKVGLLNYHALASKIDWRAFNRDVRAVLTSLGAKFYIKKDLRKYD